VTFSAIEENYASGLPSAIDVDRVEVCQWAAQIWLPVARLEVMTCDQFGNDDGDLAMAPQRLVRLRWQNGGPSQQQSVQCYCGGFGAGVLVVDLGSS
jgi:hypothetical protein